MGVHVGHQPAHARPGRDRTDLDAGVGGQQPQQLASGVAAGPGHSDPRTHGISLTIAAVSTRPCSRAADWLPEKVCNAMASYANWYGHRVRPPGNRERAPAAGRMAA